MNCDEYDAIMEHVGIAGYGSPEVKAACDQHRISCIVRPGHGCEHGHEPSMDDPVCLQCRDGKYEERIKELERELALILELAKAAHAELEFSYSHPMAAEDGKVWVEKKLAPRTWRALRRLQEIMKSKIESS